MIGNNAETAANHPESCPQCGLVVGILVVLLAYQTTLLSCRLIVVLSRKVHAASISGIVDQILGSTWRQIFSWNLALILLCILIGFMILGTTTLPSVIFTPR
jgi:amino acid permease